MYPIKLFFQFLMSVIILSAMNFADVKSQATQFENWDTNIKKKNIDLNELKSGGPPKDGIPSIDNPVFITPEEASEWLNDKEPVITVEIEDITRAYPLQIMIWHEIVNDRFNDRLKPMEKVLGIKLEEYRKAYPYSITKNEKVINDQVREQPVVIFHLEGAVSALDATVIEQSREDGSTGVYHREVDGEVLEFSWENDKITDRQTGSVWNIRGLAVDGPLEGKQLNQIGSGDYFAFAWLVFYPETEIYDLTIDINEK